MSQSLKNSSKWCIISHEQPYNNKKEFLGRALDLTLMKG